AAGSIGNRVLRQAPERAGEPEPVENRLVLLARVGPPVRWQPIVPPGMRERAQCGHADRRAGWPSAEPAFDVLLRPEEVHRASGEDDVVPPVGCRNPAVEE